MYTNILTIFSLTSSLHSILTIFSLTSSLHNILTIFNLTSGLHNILTILSLTSGLHYILTILSLTFGLHNILTIFSLTPGSLTGCLGKPSGFTLIICKKGKFSKNQHIYCKIYLWSKNKISKISPNYTFF